MRAKSTQFFINGKPMLVPDAEMKASYEDLDSSESTRDESGVMHRFPIRYKVPSWPFSYSHLTEEERQYMEGLFPNEPDFDFTRPSTSNLGTTETVVAYRSKYSISLINAATGIWGSYSFNIIEC